MFVVSYACNPVYIRAMQNLQSGSSVAGAGSAAVAAATGLVSLVGAAARYG